MVHFEDDFVLNRAIARASRLQFTSDHQSDQAVAVSLGCVDRRDILSVAHDCNTVRNGKQFLHAV